MCLTSSETRALFPKDDQYFAYFDSNSISSIRMAVDDLKDYIKSQGPYDAVLAFSQGATLAALLILDHLKDNPIDHTPAFKCGIFICGGRPRAFDGGVYRNLSSDIDGEVITIPTVHIFGSGDIEHYSDSLELSKLCDSQTRETLDHRGGHEVPRGPKITAEMASLITNMMDRAIFSM